jgi:hypothetical protein
VCYRRADAEGDFFRKLIEPVPITFVGDASHQGIYLFSAKGTLLTYLRNAYQQMDLVAMLNQGLTAFAQLPASERTPGSLTVPPLRPDPSADPTPPSDGLVLREFTRRLQGSNHQLERSTTPIEVHNMCFAASPQNDHVWITRTELEALLPSPLRVGAQVRMPETLAYRLCTMHLADTTRGGAYTWDPDDIRSREITVTVEQLSSSEATLRLDGALDFDHSKGPRARSMRATLQGQVRYRIHTQQFMAWDMVVLGTMRSAEQGVPAEITLGFAFERADGSQTGDDLPPHEDNATVIVAAPGN